MPGPGRKDFLTMQARCMLVNALLEESTTDSGMTVYVLTKGATTLRMRTLDEVGSWLRLAEWVRTRWGAPA